MTETKGLHFYIAIFERIQTKEDKAVSYHIDSYKVLSLSKCKTVEYIHMTVEAWGSVIGTHKPNRK